ncbi:MAG: PAS domain-containing protein [Candidatus Eremiobacteraeota bacterium]|nr:PAS domain-containing protein [Candidatus Eremiobacteraeota bacterium]
MNNETVPNYLVVVGASAGGVDALERLVSGLPEDFPAPMVVAQHQDSVSGLRLVDILQKQTSLRVQLLAEEMPLEVGAIYLAPGGRNSKINEQKATVASKRSTAGPSPSIDELFMSAAKSYGERTVAVILSGTGTDGASGVRVVKEHGGTVVVQEPESAAYPALPASIPLNYVDFMGGVETISSLLSAVTKPDGLQGDIADPDILKAFLAQLRGRSGIDFRQYKMPTIARRLARLMAASGTRSLSDYLRFLNSNPDGYQRLVSAFLIKVTGFFRDPPFFQYLRETVLPELISNARQQDSELRIWSAGCATGEEAYSIAILLAELLGDEVDDLPIRIFATDLDSAAISFARRGVYPASALASVSSELIAKYFTRIDDSYQVKKRVRNLTVFGEYDLGQRAPFPRIDLILCRNVLIYFTKELQQRTLQLFAFSLRVGGYLVLGKAETTNPLPQYFTATDAMLKVFRRQGERLLIPSPTFVDGAPIPERPSVKRGLLRSAIPRRPAAETAPRWSLTERLGSFLFDSPIGVVVADRNYDIVTINQAGRMLLGIHGQGIGDDLIHLANDLPPLELKAAVDAAFRSEAPAVRVLEVLDSATDRTRYIEVSCYPDKTTRKDVIEHVAVLVVDVTSACTERQAMERERNEQRAALGRLTVQNEELMQRQRSLIEANNELTRANNELRSMNEHLLIAAEEAEASAEEVETLNEEMQATSEELETLNEELQATVEELNTTNEELGARSSELERVAQDRQDKLREASLLTEVLSGAIQNIPEILCVTDAARRVVAASDGYTSLTERYPGRIPALGEHWRTIPTSIDLPDAMFTTKVVDIVANQNPALLVTLEAAASK